MTRCTSSQQIQICINFEKSGWIDAKAFYAINPNHRDPWAVFSSAIKAGLMEYRETNNGRPTKLRYKVVKNWRERIIHKKIRPQRVKPEIFDERDEPTAMEKHAKAVITVTRAMMKRTPLEMAWAAV